MLTKKTDNDEFVSPYLFSKETKPMKVYESLYPILISQAEKLLLQRHETYTFDDDHNGIGVLLLDKGLLSIHNSDNDKAIFTFFPPSILGMIETYKNFYNIPGSYNSFYYAETDVSLFFISQDKFVRTIDQHNLWHDISRLLAHRLLILKAKQSKATTSDAYEEIRILIIELWNYPEHYRNQIKLPNFIQRRTGISRSRIMKILSDLKFGGNIETKNGILVNVNKLPISY